MWGLTCMPGYYNVVKTKVKQHLQIRYFCKYYIALSLANCYNRKRFFWLKMHKTFGNRERRSPDPLDGFKWAVSQQGRTRKGQRGKRQVGSPPPLPEIIGSAPGVEGEITVDVQCDSSCYIRLTWRRQTSLSHPHGTSVHVTSSTSLCSVRSVYTHYRVSE